MAEVESPAAADSEMPAQGDAAKAPPAAALAPEPPLPQPARDTEGLPPYTRSLLSIRVPLRVTLARKTQAFSQVVRLSPGAIIQFSKACDEPLHVELGEREVALGEVVKVGEKFGVRITSMVLPEERLVPVGPPRAAGRSPTRAGN
jgi:flagellar motor switch protein FliN/FliY